MKSTFISMLALVAMTFTACGSDDTPATKTRGRLNPNAMVLIKPADGVRADGELLSAKEIVKKAINLKLWTSYSESQDWEEYNYIRTFSDNQKDTISPALKMWGVDIIAQQGYFVKDFLFGRDIVVTGTGGDTLAYVPNAVLRDAQVQITKAYNDSNYTEVYRLFDEAFKFIPITGEQWRELKKQGKQ